MKISIYAIGKLKEDYLRVGVQEFLKRLTPYAQVELIELGEEKSSPKPKANEREQIVVAEGAKILKQIKDKAIVVLLDVHGKLYSSEKLAEFFANNALQGKSDVAFIIGGAFGVAQDLRGRADLCLSFSPMTFTHQMIRLLLVEQIYRAFKINKNEPYHW